MPTLTDADKIRFADLTISAVSTDVGAQIFYFGSEKYADTEVAAIGDITLSHGATLAAKAVDTGVGLPLASPGTGIMDVSNAQADTIGEIADHLGSSANWRIQLGAMRRADSANNTLITKAATQCNLDAVSLLRDTTVAVQTNTYTIGVRVTAATLKGPNDSGWINNITEITGAATCTPGAGAGYDDGDGALDGIRVLVYAVNDILKTQRRLWVSDPQVTGVTFTFGAADWGDMPLSGNPGGALLVLIQNSGTGATTITLPSLTVKGYRTAADSGRLGRWNESNQ